MRKGEERGLSVVVGEESNSPGWRGRAAPLRGQGAAGGKWGHDGEFPIVDWMVFLRIEKFFDDCRDLVNDVDHCFILVAPGIDRTLIAGNGLVSTIKFSFPENV